MTPGRLGAQIAAAQSGRSAGRGPTPRARRSPSEGARPRRASGGSSSREGLGSRGERAATASRYGRADRLAECIAVVRALWAGGPVTTPRVQVVRGRDARRRAEGARSDRLRERGPRGQDDATAAVIRLAAEMAGHRRDRAGAADARGIDLAAADAAAVSWPGRRRRRFERCLGHHSPAFGRSRRTSSSRCRPSPARPGDAGRSARRRVGRAAIRERPAVGRAARSERPRRAVSLRCPQEPPRRREIRCRRFESSRRTSRNPAPQAGVSKPQPAGSNPAGPSASARLAPAQETGAGAGCRSGR